MSEKITITAIERKAQPSKYKPGTTYMAVYVTDQNGRRLAASGDWALAWTVGQIIDVDVETGTYQSSDGTQLPTYRIKSPFKSQFQGGPRHSPWEVAYTLALQILLKEDLVAAFNQGFIQKLDQYAVFLRGRLENGPGATAPTQPVQLPIPGLEGPEVGLYNQ